MINSLKRKSPLRMKKEKSFENEKSPLRMKMEKSFENENGKVL
jgi:hypothetical protein